MDQSVEEALRAVGLVGHARAYCNAVQLVAVFSKFDLPVLLEGETGTGKELFARCLHYSGPRRAKPFVPINCGALPDALLENELFGHARGAYTDARQSTLGLVAEAEDGTLFLDEIHALSARAQVALLRFTQDQQYRPLGSSALRSANVRIVAASNQSLKARVEEGEFRQDLYYRLNVAGIKVPPLRERREDIPILVNHILDQLCDHYKTGRRGVDASSLAWLASRDWHGNIRELENFIHREFLLCGAEAVIHIDPNRETLTCDSMPACGQFYNDARHKALWDFEERYLRTVLGITRGNVSEAARRSGKDRRVFGRLMKKHGIISREFW